jgi:hypothetical protein
MKALALAILVSTATLAAQSFSPVVYGPSEAPSNNVFPFGSTVVPFRYAQVHDDVPAMVITGMSFRHNAATTVYPAHSITMDAWMSTATTTAATMNTTFDNNHGLDKIQVVTNRTYNLPASDPINLPGLFVLDFPLDVPFVYTGAGPLCWEVQVTAKTQTGNIIYDATGSVGTATTNPALAINRTGNGCLSTGRTAVIGNSPASTMNWPGGTGMLSLAGTNLVANGATFVTFGFSHTVWNAMALPAPIPTSTGAPSGTCTVYADVVSASLVLASATGTVSYSFTFVPTPALNGTTLYSQIWGLDQSANPFGVTTSNVAIHNVVAPVAIMPVGRVYLSGSLGAVGTFGANGLVTKFY